MALTARGSCFHAILSMKMTEIVPYFLAVSVCYFKRSVLFLTNSLLHPLTDWKLRLINLLLESSVNVQKRSFVNGILPSPIQNLFFLDVLYISTVYLYVWRWCSLERWRDQLLAWGQVVCSGGYPANINIYWYKD